MVRNPRTPRTPRASRRRNSSGGCCKLTKEESYHAKMWMPMTALTGRNYQPGHKWSRQQLKSITPDKLVRYIKKRESADEEAKPDEDPPIHLRINTVLTWKIQVLLHAGHGHAVV